ncbi:hypothetical protein PPACK8108_LOCUS15381 [Phakopsora pachyrhizi]|uniref:Uncharacterized protein n=1 Tax=Phakopsora pachyrhizi TaxID=170000 RepID=A0AAV0B7P7_PHAPC|nr:hypothetical protein PPACK8108_LOCUS15381 [Phakopsora pachyrhizi]
MSPSELRVAGSEDRRSLEFGIGLPSPQLRPSRLSDGKGGYNNNHIIYKKFSYEDWTVELISSSRQQEYSTWHYQNNQTLQCSEDEEDNQRYYGVSANQETNQNSQVIPGM